MNTAVEKWKTIRIFFSGSAATLPVKHRLTTISRFKKTSKEDVQQPTTYGTLLLIPHESDGKTEK